MSTITPESNPGASHAMPWPIAALDVRGPAKDEQRVARSIHDGDEVRAVLVAQRAEQLDELAARRLGLGRLDDELGRPTEQGQIVRPHERAAGLVRGGGQGVFELALGEGDRVGRRLFDAALPLRTRPRRDRRPMDLHRSVLLRLSSYGPAAGHREQDDRDERGAHQRSSSRWSARRRAARAVAIPAAPSRSSGPATTRA